jgi:hypothetical protein
MDRTSSPYLLPALPVLLLLFIWTFIWRRIEIVMLLSVQLSLVRYYHVRLMPEYFPEQCGQYSSPGIIISVI